MVRLENPYVGPRAFGREDSQFFYGREREARQLASLVIAQRVVLLYAPSGAGKSSLINASLIPRLERRNRIKVLPVARVGGGLPPESKGVTIENQYVLSVLTSLVGEDVAPGELAGMSLSEGLKRCLVPSTDGGRPQVHLLILDQFEELFTTIPRRYEERADFVGQLQACLNEYPQLSLLISMREDFIAQLDSYTAQLPDRLRTRFRLELLGEEAAFEAVKQPASQGGVDFTDGAAHKLVDDLRQVRVQRPDATTEEQLGLHVEPVQLQVVCRSLWERLPAEATQIVAKVCRS